MNVTLMTPKNNYITYDYRTYNYMMSRIKVVDVIFSTLNVSHFRTQKKVLGMI